jgi:RNA polymerase sigma factor (sigma-70 family)
MGPGSDADVIAVSLQDPAAFGEIYERHAPVILRFLVRRVGPVAAEPVLGDSFRIAFERRTSFDLAAASCRPWLYGIAANLVRRHRRTEERRLRAMSRLAAQCDGSAASSCDDHERAIAIADARAVLPAVADAILELDDAEREVLLLFAWEGLAYDEIAVALDVPVGTVRSRLHRARRRVRDSMAVPASRPTAAHRAPGGTHGDG